jgi:hypothetical protein
LKKVKRKGMEVRGIKRQKEVLLKSNNRVLFMKRMNLMKKFK